MKKNIIFAIILITFSVFTFSFIQSKNEIKENNRNLPSSLFSQNNNHILADVIDDSVSIKKDLHVDGLTTIEKLKTQDESQFARTATFNQRGHFYDDIRVDNRGIFQEDTSSWDKGSRFYVDAETGDVIISRNLLVDDILTVTDRSFFGGEKGFYEFNVNTGAADAKFKVEDFDVILGGTDGTNEFLIMSGKKIENPEINYEHLFKVDSEGTVQTRDLVPQKDLTYDIGKPALRYRNIYAEHLIADENGVTINGDIDIDYDFTQGSVIFADAGGGLAQDNANFYWDDSNNRLGIGTTNPSSTMDINGNFTVGNRNNTTYRAIITENGINAEQSTALYSDSLKSRALAVFGNGAAYMMGRDVANDIEFVMGTSNTGAAWSGSVTNHDYQLRSNHQIRILIKNDGNVGIGTDTPESILHVQGSAFPTLLTERTTTSETNTARSGIGIGYATTQDMADGFGAGFTFRIKDSADVWNSMAFIAGARDGADNTGGLGIKTYSAGTIAANYQLWVDPTGNVGVGTTFPSSRLEVSGGDIRVTGGSFIDDGTTLNVPDYVFDGDYQLLSFDALERYIYDHRHLPNIPSREKLKQNGMNYGEMMMNILEKTEENTLYSLKNYHDIRGTQSILDVLQKMDEEKDTDQEERIKKLEEENSKSVTGELVTYSTEEPSITSDHLTSLQDQLNLLEEKLTKLEESSSLLDIEKIFTEDEKEFIENMTKLVSVNENGLTIDGNLKAVGIEADDGYFKNLQADALKIGKQSYGEVELKKGEDKKSIKASEITKDSHVMVTIIGKNPMSFSIDNIQKGEGFDLIFSKACEEDTTVQWFLIEGSKQ